MRRRATLLVGLLAATTLATLTTGDGITPANAAPGDVLFDEGFESGDLSAWDNVATSRYAVTDDPAHVKSGDYALEGTIPAGDGWGEMNKWFMPGYDELYVRFDVMFEEGFSNLRGDGNGMHFVQVSGNHVDDIWSSHGKAGIVPDGTDFFTTVVDPDHRYDDPTLRPLTFYTYYPDMSGVYGTVFTQTDPAVPTTTGVWHEIIIHVDAGTPGEYDGSQTLWIDGVKKLEVQHLRWRDTDNLRVNEFAILDYMPGSPWTQHIWFDNIVVSTVFPGTTIGDPTRFVDVLRSNLFFDDVEWLAGEGITLGCNPPVNDRYCPDDPVTRGQMAAFLVRALHYSDDGGGDRFSDDDDSVFEADIDRLATARVTFGCDPPDNTMFCPDDAVTRGQMAAFLVRALGYSDDGGGDRFVDDDTSVFAADIDRLATAGVTFGCNPPDNTMFCPTQPVTRAQMAAFLHRALG
jgi:hypothetical protein